MADKDANRGSIAKGVTDDANLTPSSLLIDPVTGRLEVEIIAVSSLPATSDPSPPIDDNRKKVAFAVTDDANLTPKPILTDTNGYILCDVNVE